MALKVFHLSELKAYVNGGDFTGFKMTFSDVLGVLSDQIQIYGELT